MVRSGNARGGLSWSDNPKPSHWGSVLAKAMWGGSFSGRGNPIWQAYTAFEVVGWCNAWRGAELEPKCKTKPPGLGFDQRNMGAFVFGERGPIGVE